MKEIDFSVVNCLSILNIVYRHRPSHNWTWSRSNSRDLLYNEKFMIDLFVTNNNGVVIFMTGEGVEENILG